MSTRHLFLFGGNPPFNKTLGKKFAQLSLNDHGKIAILFIKRPGWEKYMKKYTEVLEANGVNQFNYIPLNANPTHAEVENLKSCTGMIICGGETELYQRYLVGTIFGEEIILMYQRGVPLAGFSAGALVSPDQCVIPPVDNTKNEHLFLKGLGLIENCVVSVHFSKWNEERNLITAKNNINAAVGYGIDDEGSLYFANEHLVENLSEHYYIL